MADTFIPDEDYKFKISKTESLELNEIQKEAVMNSLLMLDFDPFSDKSYDNFVKSWKYYSKLNK